MSIAAISADSAAFPVCPVKSALSVIFSAISVGLDKFPANAKLEGVVVVASIAVASPSVRTGLSPSVSSAGSSPSLSSSLIVAVASSVSVI